MANPFRRFLEMDWWEPTRKRPILFSIGLGTAAILVIVNMMFTIVQVREKMDLRHEKEVLGWQNHHLKWYFATQNWKLKDMEDWGLEGISRLSKVGHEVKSYAETAWVDAEMLRTRATYAVVRNESDEFTICYGARIKTHWTDTDLKISYRGENRIWLPVELDSVHIDAKSDSNLVVVPISLGDLGVEPGEQIRLRISYSLGGWSKSDALTVAGVDTRLYPMGIGEASICVAFQRPIVLGMVAVYDSCRSHKEDYRLLEKAEPWISLITLGPMTDWPERWEEKPGEYQPYYAYEIRSLKPPCPFFFIFMQDIPELYPDYSAQILDVSHRQIPAF